MYWNEKIDLIKKKYTDEEFSVPHVERKKILRNIETQFIGRPKDYHYSNSFNRIFCNWWDNIKSSIDLTLDSDIRALVSSVISPNEQLWIACEFQDGIMIYKAKLNAILNLISIGQTWTEIFHIIQLKYDYLISIRIEEAETKVKASGNREFIERLKRTITQA